MSEPTKVPTLTTKSVPAGPTPASTASTAGQNMEKDWDSIRAVPLGDPGFTQVKGKRPRLSFRWINRVAGDGLRLNQAEAQGYEYATPADVIVGALKPRDGRFINGDLVLMMMSREKYLGALKHKEETALLRVSRNSGVKKGASEVPVLANKNHPLAKKVSLFVPPAAEADALVGTDTPTL